MPPRRIGNQRATGKNKLIGLTFSVLLVAVGVGLLAGVIYAPSALGYPFSGLAYTTNVMTSNGTVFTNLQYGAATTSWSSVANAKLTDGTFARVDTTSANGDIETTGYLYASGFQFQIPDTAQVTEVRAIITRGSNFYGPPYVSGFSYYWRITYSGYGGGSTGYDSSTTNQCPVTSAPSPYTSFSCTLVNIYTYTANSSGNVAGCVSDSAVSLLYASVPVGKNRAGVGFWSASQNQYVVGGDSSTWNVTLTPALVNSPNFGVGVAAKLQNSGNLIACEAAVDSIYLQVYFQTPQPTITFTTCLTCTVTYTLPTTVQSIVTTTVSGTQGGVVTSYTIVLTQASTTTTTTAGSTTTMTTSSGGSQVTQTSTSSVTLSITTTGTGGGGSQSLAQILWGGIGTVIAGIGAGGVALVLRRV